MAAYWVAVSMTAGVAAEQAEDPADRTTLAIWETGQDGLGWLEERVRAGQVQELENGCFPSVYLARAFAVLPCLTRECLAPEGELDIRPANIALCPPDEIVRIEVWAQA